MNWTDQDVDNLLASVEETLVKVDVLAKSASLKKDEDGKDKDADDAPAQDAPPADAAPAADVGAAPADTAPAADAGAAPADAGAEAPPAAAAPGAEGDQALAGEQDEDAPLSDEELSQIYSSMAPDELERHYSIIRQSLQASYSQDQGQADQAGAPAPADAAPAAPGAGAPPEMNKSEDKATIEALTKQVGEQAQAIEQITKAFEVLTKPSRKSITDIQVMHKSELDAAPADGTMPMTASQVKDGARKLQPAKLEKGEREMINKFFITGEGQEEVAKLINSKGGK